MGKSEKSKYIKKIFYIKKEMTGSSVSIFLVLKFNQQLSQYGQLCDAMDVIFFFFLNLKYECHLINDVKQIK